MQIAPPHNPPQPADDSPLGKLERLFERVHQEAANALNGVKDRAEKALNALEVLPDQQIEKLHHNGDQAIIRLVMEAWLTVPYRGFAVGPQAQYGYEATVEQSGDGPNATYQMSFGKDLIVGVHANTPSKTFGKGISATAGVEDYVKGVDSVIMTFDNKADVTKAVHIVERLALVRSAHDAIDMTASIATAQSGLLPPDPSILRNPLALDQTMPHNPDLGDLLTRGLGRNVAPSENDLKFLRDHITGNSQLVSNQARLRGGPDFFGGLPFDPSKLGKGLVGNDFRLDRYDTITRTMKEPRNGHPGSLTYAYTGELDVSSRKKLKGSWNHPGEEAKLHHKILSKLGISPQVLEDHVQLQAQVSLTWPVDNADKSPDLDVVAHHRTPAAVTVQLSGWLEDQLPFVDLTRTDYKRVIFTATIAHPDAATRKRVLSGDFSDLKWEIKQQTVRRDGINGLVSVGLQLPNIGGDISISPIGNFGSNTVVKESIVKEWPGPTPKQGAQQPAAPNTPRPTPTPSRP